MVLFTFEAIIFTFLFVFLNKLYVSVSLCHRFFNLSCFIKVAKECNNIFSIKGSCVFQRQYIVESKRKIKNFVSIKRLFFWIKLVYTFLFEKTSINNIYIKSINLMSFHRQYNFCSIKCFNNSTNLYCCIASNY